jgi:hypothetical protein
MRIGRDVIALKVPAWFGLRYESWLRMAAGHNSAFTGNVLPT